MRAVLASALAILAVEAAAPEPAVAQGSFQQTVTNKLAGMASRAREQGYATQLGQTQAGSLAQGATHSLAVSLVAGGNYLIIGACDQDCTDVDLRILGPGGGQVTEDVALDDRPVLRFTAPATGTYRLDVIMATCSTSPCYWGVQTFAR